MSSFRIEGGHQLKGEIIPQGAKNEALQIIAATLLSPEPVTIHKIPDIRDVNKLIELVAEMGHAIEMGSDMEDIGLTVHAHPTGAAHRSHRSRPPSPTSARAPRH